MFLGDDATGSSALAYLALPLLAPTNLESESEVVEGSNTRALTPDKAEQAVSNKESSGNPYSFAVVE